MSAVQIRLGQESRLQGRSHTVLCYQIMHVILAKLIFDRPSWADAHLHLAGNLLTAIRAKGGIRDVDTYLQRRLSWHARNRSRLWNSDS